MDAVKGLILKMADDALIMGHRNSEWTGLGPVLEEDIAFSSMAQDKIGHALALYGILHEQFGAPEPDQIAFAREESKFRCCHFVELPIGEYDFSLVRHFLFDHAEAIRYEMLSSSSFDPLAKLARKVKGEIKYHVLHANSWLQRLGNGTEQSHRRMQSALNFCIPYALGIFEKSTEEEELIEQEIFAGEELLQTLWEERIKELIEKAGLLFHEVPQREIHKGGRSGKHTHHLHMLLEEMSQVIRMESRAEW
jgi:ring-1,2-phenylacetyl-CoA epoxidase subunit PaaC